jgi:hypothetical protein
MPISNIAEDGAITADKINEIIDAINDLSISWINFNGNPSVAIRASVGNISGVTRTGSGQYRISFTTARSTADYAVAGNCTATAGNDTGFVMLTAQTTTYCDIYCRNDDGGANDCSIVSLFVVGG